MSGGQSGNFRANLSQAYNDDSRPRKAVLVNARRSLAELIVSSSCRKLLFSSHPGLYSSSLFPFSSPSQGIHFTLIV